MADTYTAGAVTNVLDTSSAKPVPIVAPEIKDDGLYTGGPINLNGNRINYSREQIDQFRLKFGPEAQNLLAKDAVMSYALTDFKDEMKKDKDFLTYDGLINGTATILNHINDPKLQLGEISGNFNERPKVQKKMDSDEILKFFTTLEDADLTDTFAREMFKATQDNLPADVAIFSAAVADFKVKEINNNKIKKQEKLHLELEKNIDILNYVSKHNSLRPKLVIGFAAETDDVEVNAKKKLEEKNCDWIIANDVSNKAIGFNSSFNEVSIYYRDKNMNDEKLTIKSKSEISDEIVDRVIKKLN